MSYFKRVIIDDEYGLTASNTLEEELRVAMPVRLVGTLWEGAVLDPNFWTITASGSTGGTGMTLTNGVATIACGSGSASYSMLSTKRRARFVTTQMNGYRAIIQLPDAGAANNKRRWGVGYYATLPTITNGAWFQLNGTTFSVVTCLNGVESVVSSGSFNGTEGAAFTPGVTANVYEIYYDIKTIIFSVGDEILHRVDANVLPWSNQMSLYAFADNRNAGNTSLVNILARIMAVRRYGILDTNPATYHITTAGTYILKYGAGSLHRIVINDTGGTVITVYDGISAGGTVIAVLTGSKFNAPLSLDYKVPFNDGLTIVTTGTWDLTIVYE